MPEIAINVGWEQPPTKGGKMQIKKTKQQQQQLQLRVKQKLEEPGMVFEVEKEIDDQVW